MESLLRDLWPALLVIGVQLAMYPVALVCWKKGALLSNRNASTLQRVHFILLGLVLLLAFFALYGWNYRGRYTDFLILWGWWLSGMFLFAASSKEALKDDRHYFKFLFYLPLANIGLGFLSYIGWAFIFIQYSPLAMLQIPPQYADGRYRVEYLMSSNTLPDLVVKNGLLERVYAVDDEPLGPIKHVVIEEKKEDEIVVSFVCSLYRGNTDPLAPDTVYRVPVCLRTLLQDLSK